MKLDVLFMLNIIAYFILHSFQNLNKIIYCKLIIDIGVILIWLCG